MHSAASKGVGSKQYGVSSKGFAPYFLLLTSLLILLTLTNCQSTAPVVKVGLVAPFEGRDRAIGYDAIYSARLAVREINAAGGIGGYRIALVALDDSGDPELAQGTAESLVIDDNVVAVVGHWRPQTTAVAAPIYASANLAFLAGGESPYQPTDPADLEPDFIERYTAVTPFNEQPGPYAEPTYAAFQTLWKIFEDTNKHTGSINRGSVQQALHNSPPT